MHCFRLTTFLIIWFFCAPPVWAAEPLRVSVEGIEEGDALTNVQAALAIPPGFIRDGKVEPAWVNQFEQEAPEKVMLALEPFGFYNARVTTSLETVGEGSYLLRVKVEPGKPVVVTEVHVALEGPGADNEELRDIVDNFPLNKGDVLLQQPYETTRNALKVRAAEIGYLDADYSSHEIRISSDKSTARIDLVLRTGPVYRFDGTEIAGAPDYPDRFLRRYLAYKPGDTFSTAKINDTQLNFISADRFRGVIVTPEKEKIHDQQVPVLVKLEPTSNRRLRIGAGYGTDTGFRFIGRYRDVNMFRRGHELSSELYVAQRLQGLGFGYLIPSAKNINSSTGVQLNLQREEVTTYTSSLISVEGDRNRGFGPGLLGTAYLRFLQEDFTVGTEKSSAHLILPGLRFVMRRYDDLIRPTRGLRLALEVRGTHQVLGSDTGLIQFLADGNVIFPLPGRFSVSARGKFGMTAQNDPLADLPVSLRFFAGGDTSVRGYSYQSLGPRDAKGNVEGGKDLVVGSVEIERALFEKWGVSAFYDTGNAFNTFTGIRLYSGAGMGVHYYTRFGAINLYFARQIGVASPANHVHLTMGFEL